MGALYLTETLRRVESRALAREKPLALMTRAAQAVSNRVATLLRQSSPGLPVVALVGPGNNGGDALLASVLLRRRGFDARAVMLHDGLAQAQDAARVLTLARESRLPLSDTLPEQCSPQDALFIDGLFGIGLTRPLQGKAREWVERLNHQRARVVAVDVPSGIAADSGAIVGAKQGVAIKAEQTVTFLGDKPGLHTAAGLDHVGLVTLDSLGVPLPDRDGTLIDGAELMPLTRRIARMRDSHKGRYGQAAALGGTLGMQGAVLLAALGAQRVGAGKVFVASPDRLPLLNLVAPELIVRPASDSFDDMDAVAVGCGLGLASASRRLLGRILDETRCSLVLDADALNLVAGDTALSTKLEQRRPLDILTPHPLEAARLAATDVQSIQQSRLTAAALLATRLRSVVVLKGAGTIVASPGGDWAVVGAGSPSLATAGTGDVLAGVVCGLLAQGLSPGEAACLGSWIHARAGEEWAKETGGELGLASSELPERVRLVLNRLINDASQSPNPLQQSMT